MSACWRDVLEGRALWSVDRGDALDWLRGLPDGCAQTCCTSPPYYALRDYGTSGQIGLEPTVDAYVERLCGVFAELRRVLRPDGTLWLSLGDSYASGGGKGAQRLDRLGERLGTGGGHKHTSRDCGRAPPSGLPQKNLLGVPWRVAFALQAAGWWLRSDIIWHKLSPMPESVTDRPTKSHEYLFLLSRSARYFYDAEAVKTAAAPSCVRREGLAAGGRSRDETRTDTEKLSALPISDAGANLRSVWPLANEPCSEAHFAVMPSALVEPCVLAGTSAHGACAACGAPWRRVVERKRGKAAAPSGWRENGTRWTGENVRGVGEDTSAVTLGWAPSCRCNTKETRPCVVLDPFAGSGTVGLVARRRGRAFLGCDLNEKYCDLARRRLADVAPLVDAAAAPSEAAQERGLFDGLEG